MDKTELTTEQQNRMIRKAVGRVVNDLKEKATENRLAHGVESRQIENK